MAKIKLCRILRIIRVLAERGGGRIIRSFCNRDVGLVMLS